MEVLHGVLVCLLSNFTFAGCFPRTNTGDLCDKCTRHHQTTGKVSQAFCEVENIAKGTYLRVLLLFYLTVKQKGSHTTQQRSSS